MMLRGSSVVAWIWSLTLLALLVPAHVRASEGPPPILNIKTYRSPSGEYELIVDPSRLHGHGPGSYRVSRAGRELWSKTIDFTLWDAAITDTGVVAGYAYTHGWRGFPEEPGGTWNGEYITAIFNPDGSERLVKRTQRQEGGLHMPPNPVAQGFFIDADNDRVVYRFRSDRDDTGERPERWEIFKLSTAEPLPAVTLKSFKPEGQAFSMIVDAKPVRGSGLVLVMESIYRFGKPPATYGLRLALVDAQCKEVWSKEWPDEFAGVERFSPWDLGPANVLPDDGVAPSQFVYRSFGEKARITFTAARDPASPSGWSIKEAARAADTVQLERDRNRPLNHPEIVLEPRGVITLDKEANADNAPLNILTFEFDGSGRIGFIPFDPQDPPQLTLMDRAGKIVKRIQLNFKPEEKRGFPQFAWLRGSRWVIVRPSYDRAQRTEGYWLDADTGLMTPIENFDCPKPESQRGLAATGDGGFIVIGAWDDPSMVAFDAQGNRRWVVERLGADDVCVRPDGEIGVLNTIPPQILTYSRAGELLRTIDLEDSLGYKPDYVSALEADEDGGWLMHDFGAESLMYHLTTDGKSRSTFRCSLPDGGRFSIVGGIRRAADGSLWATDKSAIYRLDAAGRVAETLGRAATDQSTISELGGFVVGHDGRLYATDRRNSTIHIFSPDGSRLRVITPDPADITVGSGSDNLAVAGDGTVYLMTRRGILEASTFISFDAEGRRADPASVIGGEVKEEWLFRPGGQERLILGYENVFLVNAEGAIARTVNRRADRRWLDDIGEGAIAADGSFAVMGGPSSWGDGGEPSITLYTPQGEPIRTLDLPGRFVFARVAFNGKTACVLADDDLVLLDAATGTSRVFKTGLNDKKSWLFPHMSPDGSEVWLLNPKQKTVARYALP